MPIEPSSVTLNSRDVQEFRCDQEATWSAAPSIGKLEPSGASCKYTAPLVLLSRNVTITARSGAGEEATATVALSSGPFWMAALTTYWVLLFPALLAGIFYVWPPPVAAPWVDVFPPAVTVSPGGLQQFSARVWNADDPDVDWSASAGTITPTGLFTAPAEGTSVTVTAMRKADRSQLGTSLVLPGTSLQLTPAFTQLGPSQTATLKAVSTTPADAAPAAATKLTWMCSAPPDHPCSVSENGQFKAPDTINRITRVVVTAAAGDRKASAVLLLVPKGAGVADALASQLGRDQSLIQLVLLMGALGAFLGASRSFVNYVGNRQFSPSWSLFYVFRPSLGAGLALLVFFAYRIGAVTGPGTTSSADPFAAGFVAGLVGLFVDPVLGKLQEIVGVLFPSREPRKDPMQAPATPVPTLQSATGSLAAGKMTVTGTGFVEKAKVSIGGTPRDTTFVGQTELTAKLDAATDSVGTVKVKVVNPDGKDTAEIDGSITA